MWFPEHFDVEVSRPPQGSIEVGDGEAEVHPRVAAGAEAHEVRVGVLDELDQEVVDGEADEDLVVDFVAVQALKTEHTFEEGADGVDVFDDDTGVATLTALRGFDRSSESLPCLCSFELGDDVEDTRAGDECKCFTHQLDEVMLIGRVRCRSTSEPCLLRAPCRASNEPNDQVRGHVGERVDVEALGDDRCQAIAHRLGTGTQPLCDVWLCLEEFSPQRTEFCYLWIELGPFDE
jgi:hypothetical protein